MRFQLALDTTFCLTPQHITHRRLKHRQGTKINKTMLSSSPSSVFHTKFTISELKSNKYSILTVSELGPPVSESSTRISKLYIPTDLEHKFNKWGSKTAYPQHSISDRLDSEPSDTTLKTFQLPEPKQVFSNPTPVTLNSITSQWKKNQPPLA